MWNKRKQKYGKAKKLSGEIFEYLLLSVIAAAFTFIFLYLTSQSVAHVYLERRQIVLDSILNEALDAWLRGVCIAASVGIFVVLFLLLLGQKLSYLIRIINGVEKLQNKEEFQIPLEGDDELTQLAENINHLTLSWKRLEQKECEMKEARESFIRSLSHDIRTPLTSMLSYTELLEKRQSASSDEIRDYLRLVRTKSVQIRELMEQLLDGKEGNRENIKDMRFLVEQLAAEWEELLEDRFACRTDISGCGSFSGKADISALRRMMDNLVSNVEKYADPSKEVELVIQNRGNELIIRQKNGVRNNRDSRVESRYIGLENIREIAGAFGGQAREMKTEGEYRIEITLQIPPFL